VPVVVRDDHDGPRERHGLAPDERRKRVRPDDSVAAYVLSLIHI